MTGRISKIGDGTVRTMLYEAAHVILTRPVSGSRLKSWGMRLARRAGMNVPWPMDIIRLNAPALVDKFLVKRFYVGAVAGRALNRSYEPPADRNSLSTASP